MKKVFRAISQSCQLIVRHPFIASPFVVLALCEALTLYLLFLAPQEPFSKVLAPPIERIWGEQFVHYPWHLLVLPKLFSNVRLYLLSFLPGMFISAIVVGLVGDIQTGQAPKFRRPLKTSLRRFFSLLVIWLLNLGVLKLIEFAFVKTIGWGESKAYVTTLEFSAYFIVFLAQALFLYAIPAIILAKQSLFKALLNNFRYYKKLFLPTSLCFIMASLIYLGLYFFERDIQGIAARTQPEIIVVILSASIAVTFVVNIFITMVTTILFVDEQSNDPKGPLITGEAS